MKINFRSQLLLFFCLYVWLYLKVVLFLALQKHRGTVGFLKSYSKKLWQVSRKSPDLLFSEFLVKMTATKIRATLDQSSATYKNDIESSYKLMAVSKYRLVPFLVTIWSDESLSREFPSNDVALWFIILIKRLSSKGLPLCVWCSDRMNLRHSMCKCKYVSI